MQKISKYIQSGSEVKGFNANIEKETLKNKNFRKVLYTGKYSQLVLMSLKVDEEIGVEVHKKTDQFFRVEAGTGKAIINDTEYKISNGSSIVVPAGAKHNIINTGKDDLKLYSVYSPSHHADGTVHKTKKDALNDTEKFDGKTTE
jgi:mannose-6-phosphate isomerase-like protein (cupin superfamily)